MPGYSQAPLEGACERALAIGSPSYRSLSSILKQGLDRQPFAATALVKRYRLSLGPKPTPEDDDR